MGFGRSEVIIICPAFRASKVPKRAWPVEQGPPCRERMRVPGQKRLPLLEINNFKGKSHHFNGHVPWVFVCLLFQNLRTTVLEYESHIGPILNTQSFRQIHQHHGYTWSMWVWFVDGFWYIDMSN